MVIVRLERAAYLLVRSRVETRVALAALWVIAIGGCALRTYLPSSNCRQPIASRFFQAMMAVNNVE